MKGIQLLCSMDLNILIKILLNLWLLQSYSNQNSMELAQKQTPSSMIQDRKLRNKQMNLWLIYLWAFCFVPLIYTSVFVPVPYCLDDCTFVVEPDVRQLIPSVPFLFLKIALAIWGFFWYVHTNCEIICSSSMKNTIGSLIGIALNL